LDTWFSSALWPFSTLGWPVKTKDLERYYPTTVLVTGFDIIFFWVARMMMMGLKMMGEVPFKTVVLHPLVRDERGQKMSKSKGNVIDPLELLSVHGADSFRFTLASQAGQARDLKLNSKRVEGYSKFVNKLWNAARFSLSHLKKSRQHLFGAPQSLPDRWILSRLAAVTAQCRAALEEFHFDRYTDLLYQFIWYEFCDWYLELIKPILYGSDEASKESTLAALEQALRDILALTHPVMPFVTEELWSKIPQNDSFLMTSPYPAPRSEDIDQEAERLVGSLMELTRSVRQARSDFGVPPASKLSPIVATSDPLIAELFKAQGPLLLNLMGASKLELADPDMQKPKEAASNILSWGEVWTPLAGHIDPKAESARLSKEADKLAKDIKAAQAKLNNPDYIKKAPPEIVEETAERLETMQTRLEAIERSKALVNALSD
jgi:valyl-tRNA synthetase